ncbi:glycosyltransferase family 2 protein [Ulvibacter antarcticus]|uniref:GT2 family glycosyltransferase n=1 Tax=Ulvibacter antarcticus TaxID=442714 RepID=A0A3L9YK46_9FLAO|nr:glycosyltransferase family 2 protein [Ulvibacter antarcticus]RMA58485.1 GT2 family glycosyltransferase [Ulvibacter antarcticus]
MKLTVVILNYNVRYFLEQCIQSVQSAIKNIDAEIIVIDNDSKDDSCEMMKSKFPQIQLIENRENVGFSKANNQAVKVAKGEYVCILNPDTAVAEDAFLNSLKYAESLEKMGALGVYLMDGTGNYLPESKRNIPTPAISLLKLLGRVKSYYANHLGDKEKGEVEVLVGAYMLLKRSVYNEVSGFDEDYFMYGEDIDLSYKILNAGYKNHYLGSLNVLHYKGESTQKNAKYYERFYGAMQIFYKKHFKPNPILNFAVNAGVFIMKKLRHTSEGKNQAMISTEQAYVFTENFSLFKKISEKIEIPVKNVSKSMLEDQIIKNAMLIFDVDYMPYSQIFSVMDQLKNKNNQFRIRPKNCNFILGSDTSDEKGHVMVF